MSQKNGSVFEVNKADWSQCRIVPEVLPDGLGADQVLLKLDRFALTSNNITYAAIGEPIGYWKFFPAEDGWGRIPAMGFADVVKSTHADVLEGERVFGFFPMAHHLLINAGKVNNYQFVDVSEHRADTAPVYRQYTRTTTDAKYEKAYEDQHLLLWGLFMTSFLVDDLIADSDFFGAEAFVIASASSKTAIALAHQLHERGRGDVIGLTSERNLSFVEGLDFYDRAVSYENIESLAADVPVVFVDHSGSGDVVNRVHRQYGDNVKYSCIVGMTHIGAAPRDSGLPGAEPAFFFAPGQIQKRTADWGPEGLEQRIGDAWRRFRDSSDAWLNVKRDAGKEAVERVYREVLEGRARPDEGHVLSMWD